MATHTQALKKVGDICHSSGDWRHIKADASKIHVLTFGRWVAFDVATAISALALKASAADILFVAATPKFAAQIIRKTHELGWRPMQIVVTAATQMQTVLKPAGLDASKGLLTSQWIKEVGDPAWDNDPAMQDFKTFIAKWVPGAKPEDASTTYAYSTAQMIHEVLRRCGDDLSRENVIKQATNIKGFQLPLFIPGVTINVSPTSRIGWRQARLAKFDGTTWVPFGDIITIPESATKR